MDYYDLILGTIPASFVAVAGSLSLAGVATTIAIPVAATVAIALIAHAMFVRSPLDEREDRLPARDSTGRASN